MQDLTKAQITIGLLAFFATVWVYIKYAMETDADLTLAAYAIGLNFVVMIILAFVILAILQWVRVFDIKTNSILTLITIVTIPLISEVLTI
jgi:hypothetical protein